MEKLEAWNNLSVFDQKETLTQFYIYISIQHHSLYTFWRLHIARLLFQQHLQLPYYPFMCTHSQIKTTVQSCHIEVTVSTVVKPPYSITNTSRLNKG